MADHTRTPYRRLQGTGYRRLVPGWAIVLLFFVIGIFALLLRGRRVQLWLGDAHLMQVEWDGYREYYKRFGYADIQTIMIRKTADGRNGNIVLACVTVLFTVLSFSTQDMSFRIAWMVIAGFFGLFLMVNTLLGPTCRCHLRTAVQTEELPSLSRLRGAHKALGQLRPLIEKAQGAITTAEIAASLQEPNALRAAPASESATLAPVAGDPSAEAPRLAS